MSSLLGNNSLAFRDGSGNDIVKGTVSGSDVLDFTTNGGGDCTLSGIKAATADDHAVNKAQLDAAVAGFTWKASVRGAVSGNFAATLSGNVLTASANGVFALGGLSDWATSERVLLYGQSTAAHNGIYTITTLGSGSAAAVLTRATDSDTATEMKGGVAVFVREGTQADQGWVCTTDGDVTLNTTSLAFAQFSSQNLQAGDGLTKTGSTLAVQVTTSKGLAISSDALEVVPDSSTITFNGSGQVQVGTITSANVGTNAIATAALQDDCVTQAEIADDAVGNDQLAANAVQATQINASAVTSAKIASGAVTSAKMDSAITISGAFVANSVSAGTVSATSDQRLKENFQAIEPEKALEMVQRMEAVRYNFKSEPGRRRIGFVAQQAEHWCEECVTTNPETGYKQIEYTALIPILAASIQHLQKQVKALENRVAELKQS
jgi:hypothetical protein